MVGSCEAHLLPEVEDCLMLFDISAIEDIISQDNDIIVGLVESSIIVLHILVDCLHVFLVCQSCETYSIRRCLLGIFVVFMEIFVWYAYDKLIGCIAELL